MMLRFVCLGITVLDNDTGELIFEGRGDFGRHAASSCAGKLNTEMAFGRKDIDQMIAEIEEMQDNANWIAEPWGKL